MSTGEARHIGRLTGIHPVTRDVTLLYVRFVFRNPASAPASAVHDGEAVWVHEEGE
jgi:hypothetical protein